MSLALLLCVVLLAWEVETLTCKCDGCIATTGRDYCIVDYPDGYCISLTKKPPGSNKITLERKCSNSTEIESSSFCNISSSTLATFCCSTHFCNTNIQPVLTNRTDQGHTVIPPTLIPGPGEPTTEDSEEPTDIPPLITCLKYNSQKPTRGNKKCYTVNGSCYRIQRLDPVNGTLLFEKYGCMVNCTNDTRKRVIRECCNTTSCNNYTQPLLQAQPQNPIQTRITISSSSSTAHSSASSSTRLTLTSTTHLSHSTTSRISTRTPNIQTPTPIITNSGEVITIVQDSDSFSSILIPLCIVYLFVTVLVVSLVAVICYKQRQVRRLETTVRTMKVTGAASQSGSMLHTDRTTSTSSDMSTSV